MPSFPEQLYQLSVRDLQGTWLDPLIQLTSESAGTTNVVANFTIPEGRALLLNFAGVEGRPGTGQNIVNSTLLLTSEIAGASTFIFLAVDNIAKAANVNAMLSWTGATLLVPPTWLLQANVNYNAAVTNNVTRLHLHGLLIPVANIQRV